MRLSQVNLYVQSSHVLDHKLTHEPIEFLTNKKLKISQGMLHCNQTLFYSNLFIFQEVAGSRKIIAFER